MTWVLNKNSIHIFFALIITVVIVLTAYYLHKIVQKYIVQLNQIHHLPIQIVKAIEFLSKIVIYSIAGILILENFHVQITALFGTFGIIAVGIGFSLQNTLADVTSGLFILYNKPFFIGDYIHFTSNELKQDLEGTIVDINLQSTELEHNGDKILIPNNLIYRSAVIIKQQKKEPAPSKKIK